LISRHCDMEARDQVSAGPTGSRSHRQQFVLFNASLLPPLCALACVCRWWRATAGRFQRSEIGLSWKREWGKREVGLPLRVRHYKRHLHLGYTQIYTLRCVRVSDFWYYRADRLAKSTRDVAGRDRVVKSIRQHFSGYRRKRKLGKRRGGECTTLGQTDLQGLQELTTALSFFNVRPPPPAHLVARALATPHPPWPPTATHPRARTHIASVLQ
jgi:hypothetical protein